MQALPLITLRHATVRLPGQAVDAPALRDISCELRSGRHLALLGENGAGKSTLLRLMRGDIWITSGEILWHTAQGAENAPLAGRAMTALVSPAQHAGYLRQGWRLSGRELLRTGFDDTPLVYRQALPEQEEAITGMAELLHAAHLLEKPIAQFSQGQLRIMLLARALLRQPQVLLLDECTEGLDGSARNHFLSMLERTAQSCTVVMTTHRASLLPGWFRESLYLERGVQRPIPAGLSGGGTAADARRALFATPGVLSATSHNASGQNTDSPERPRIEIHHATVYVSGDEDFDGVKWILSQEGHTSDPGASPAGTGRRPALLDICWTLRPGEGWLIHGPNGAGKSTLLRLLAGDEHPAAGGSITRRLPRHGGETTMLEDIRRGIRLVSDLGEALYGYDMTVLELVCSGFDNTIGLYREITGEERKAARTLLHAWGLAELAERSFRTLSSGQLRICFLARALMGDPEILLLDEPCSGLDARTRAAYLDCLQQAAEGGTQVILVSHHDSDRIPALNRTARMEGGRLFVE
ncbi:MAG: ATP-binding cassette domain-containing protein [Desulfovibrionaceae bacterium]|nr:ATP-binding cassette domain-containing protein [Desulfovibrionaceae bacterium]